jgi:hypothetical protein
MAIDAKRLHFTKHELHQVTLMSLDMVDNTRRFDLAALSTHPAQRFDPELMRRTHLPPLAMIPAVDFSGVHHHAIIPLINNLYKSMVVTAALAEAPAIEIALYR